LETLREQLRCKELGDETICIEREIQCFVVFVAVRLKIGGQVLIRVAITIGADVLKSPTAYEMLERSVLQQRLLLCLHGIGTNAGLQRMAGLESGVTVKDLSYVRHRYISVDALRRAIAIVADGTLKARNPAIWGSGTTTLCLRFQTLRPGTRISPRNGTCVTAGVAS
jgi:hypothetical protein